MRPLFGASTIAATKGDKQPWGGGEGGAEDGAEGGSEALFMIVCRLTQ